MRACPLSARWSAAALAGAALALPVLLLAAPAQAAAPLRHGSSDFNGDGYEDLVVGAPGGLVAGQVQAGYVVVIPGSAQGPVPSARHLISQDTGNVPGAAGYAIRFGASVATGDINGDGFSDLAVGAPGDDDNGSYPKTGSLTVLFGSATGLGHPVRVLGTYGLGTALTTADMDGDGRPEIIATETPNNFGEVVRFTVAQGSRRLVRSPTTSGYGLGALAAGDLDGDGDDDVVSLYTSTGGSPGFAVHLGGPAGLSSAPERVDATLGGADLTIGDLDGDGRADLVLGQPAGNPDQSGQVSIWRGAPGGLEATPSRTLRQGAGGVPDTAERDDQFGSTVALGDLDGDNHPELVIGTQYEGVRGRDGKDVPRAGAVTVLHGTPTGPTTTGAARLARGNNGLAGAPTLNDQLGWLASIHDLNGDGDGDLTITAIGGNASADSPYYGDGSVTVISGSPSGLSLNAAKVLRPGALKLPASGARFGWSLAR